MRRESHSLCSVAEDIVVVGGVHDLQHHQFSSCEMLLRTEDRWIILPNQPYPVDKSGLAAFNHNSVYSFGGFTPHQAWVKTITKLDLGKLEQRWTIIPVELQESNNHFSVVALSPSSLLIFGGLVYTQSLIFHQNQTLSSSPFTALYHDTLTQINLFKSYKSLIFTTEYHYSFKVLGHKNWRDVAELKRIREKWKNQSQIFHIQSVIQQEKLKSQDKLQDSSCSDFTPLHNYIALQAQKITEFLDEELSKLALDEWDCSNLVLNSFLNCIEKLKQVLSISFEETKRVSLKRPRKMKNQNAHYFLKVNSVRNSVAYFNCKTNQKEEQALLNCKIPFNLGACSLKSSLVICGIRIGTELLSPQVIEIFRHAKYAHLKPIPSLCSSYSICAFDSPEDLVVATGKAYQEGGRKSYLFKKREQKWRNLPELRFDADKAGIISHQRSKVYCFGGFTQNIGWIGNIQVLEMSKLQRGWKILSLSLVRYNSCLRAAALAKQSFIHSGVLKFSEKFATELKAIRIVSRFEASDELADQGFKSYRGKIVNADKAGGIFLNLENQGWNEV